MGPSTRTSCRMGASSAGRAATLASQRAGAAPSATTAPERHRPAAPARSAAATRPPRPFRPPCRAERRGPLPLAAFMDATLAYLAEQDFPKTTPYTVGSRNAGDGTGRRKPPISPGPGCAPSGVPAAGSDRLLSPQRSLRLLAACPLYRRPIGLEVNSPPSGQSSNGYTGLQQFQHGLGRQAVSTVTAILTQTVFHRCERCATAAGRASGHPAAICPRVAYY